MDLIVTDHNFIDVKRLDHVSFDFECGDTNDFKVVIMAEDYSDQVAAGNAVYALDSECGGIIGEVDTNTEEDEISLKGYTWRGLLGKKIIIPDGDYKTVTGELNDIIGQLLSECYDTLFISSDEDTGVTVSGYKFDRYCTLLDGLTKMLASVDYRLQIDYVPGIPGQVILSAKEVKDWSAEIELSQDSQIGFKMENIHNGINHLICLGQGNLSQRDVAHLYVDGSGNIGTTQYYFGIDELVAVYDNTGAESHAKLIEEGKKRMKDLMSQSNFSMDVSALDMDVYVGDIIGGRDYLTGASMTKPVKAKIWRETDNTLSIEYKLEGN